MLTRIRILPGTLKPYIKKHLPYLHHNRGQCDRFVRLSPDPHRLGSLPSVFILFYYFSLHISPLLTKMPLLLVILKSEKSYTREMALNKFTILSQ